MYCESKALEENFLNYALLCLKGKYGWAPFLHIIQKKGLKRVVNYSEIRYKMIGISD